MNINKYTGIIVIALLGFIAYGVSEKTTFLRGNNNETFSETTVTPTTLTGNVSQPVGSNGSRKYVRIDNASQLPLFCIAEGSVAAASSRVSTTTAGGYGIYINARSTTTTALPYWESYGYTGVVNCAAGGSTASTTVTTAP